MAPSTVLGGRDVQSAGQLFPRWRRAAWPLPSRAGHSASKMPAAPMPVPMHMVTMPYFCWRRRRPWTMRGGAHRAGGAERMAQRDRAAERIDLRGIEAEVADHGQRLRGERFVELDPVDLRRASGRPACSAFGIAAIGPMPMISRRHAGDREAGEARQRLQAVVLDRLLARRAAPRRAVGHLRAVAGRHRAAAAVAEHRLELREAFDACVSGARAFVDGRRMRRASPDRVAEVRARARSTSYGEISAANSPAGDRRERLLVRGEGERVLVLARDLPLLGDLLGGDAHAVGDRDVARRREHAAGSARPCCPSSAPSTSIRCRRRASGRRRPCGSVGGERDGLQAGRAEAVDRLRGDVWAGRRAARRCARRSCLARPRAWRSR